MKRALGVVALCACVFSAENALGQELDRKQRAQARAYADQGQALFDRGDYKGAVEKFTRADSIAPVPTVQVALARALKRLGKLADSAAKYRQAAAAEVTADSPPALIDAVVVAKADLADLLPRVPSLQITVGAGVMGVAIDGIAIPADQLTTPVPVNPGTHVVSATGTPAVRVTLNEGEHRRVLLAAPPKPDSGTDWRLIGGWTGIGIGAVALGASIVSTARLVTLNDELRPYRSLPPYDTKPDVCAFAENGGGGPALSVDNQNIASICRQARVVGGIQFALYPLHALSTGVGIYLLVTSKSAREEGSASRVRVLPRIGMTGGGVDVAVRF